MRPLVGSDRRWVAELLSDTEVRRWTSRRQLGPLAAKLAAWWEVATRREAWAIVERATGEGCGWIEFVRFEGYADRVSLEFELRPKYWGRGFMAEAIGCLLTQLFSEQPVCTVSVVVLEENIRARRALEKAGFSDAGLEVQEARRLRHLELCSQAWLRRMRPYQALPGREAAVIGLPVMDAGSLLLRPARDEDVEWLAQMRSDAKVSEWLLNMHAPTWQAKAVEWAEMRIRPGRSVIANRLTGEPYGWIWLGELTGLDPLCVGYAIRSERWGQGIATSAVTRVMEFAFAELTLPSLAAVVFRENRASRRVLEKCGFELTRDGLFGGHESVFFSQPRESWMARRAAPRTTTVAVRDDNTLSFAD